MDRLIINTLIILIILHTSIAYCSDITLLLSYPDVDASPYQVGDNDSIADPPGIAVEIIASAIKEVNLKVKFWRLPNKRIKKYLKNGEIDGAFLLSYKNERKDLGVYPMKDGRLDSARRVATVSYSLYKRKGDGLQWDGQNISGIGNRKITANKNYSIVKDLKKLGVEVEEVYSTKRNFVLLMKGRVAGAAVHGVTGDAIISKEDYSEIEKIRTPLSVKDYFLMFSHQFTTKHSDIAEKIWTKIGEIRESKTKKIASKYN